MVSSPRSGWIISLVIHVSGISSFGIVSLAIKQRFQKLRDVRHEDIPEINNPKIRFPVLEGDKLMKEVLNGGYNVHPVPPPNSEIKERITERYERERIKIEKLLTLGYTTSHRIIFLSFFFYFLFKQ